MKRSLLFLLACSFVLPVFGQQLPLFNQHREHIGLINPAALSSDYLLYENPLTFAGSYRVQWSQFENAPRTQTIQGTHVWSDGDAFGLMTGGSIMNDQTGPTGFTGLYGRIAGVLSDDLYYGGISAGLTFGMVQYRVDGTEIRLREQGDLLADQDYSQWYPDVGLGIYYYTLLEGGLFDDSHVYGGISIPQVFGLSLQYKGDGGDFETTRIRHYYAQGGMILRLREDRFLEPSVWMRYVPNTPPSIDANLRYQMQAGMWIGTGVSSSKSARAEIGFLLGQNQGFNNTFKIGYAMGFSFAEYGPSTGASHELNVSYGLGQ